MLSAKNIKKSFKGKEVLHGVDIEVHAGRVSVLIGPSGSGKTTLVRALALLDLPNEGHIAFDGHTYQFPLQKGKAVEPPWPIVTVVFQQYFLWPHLTLRENIVLPLANRSNTHHSVEELIQNFSMQDFIDRYPNEVSLGQRQRAALARAFALEPKYILLDEITSALDVEQTGVVVRHLLTLRNRGIGILVVTHLLEFARQLVARNEGDQVNLLVEGRILGSGGSEFFDNPGSARAQRFLSSIDYWSGSDDKSSTKRNRQA